MAEHQRHRFALSQSDGASASNTARFTGELVQFRWYPTVADTGQVATIALSVLPSQDDTGVGWQFYAEDGMELGVGATRYPRVLTTDTGGEVSALTEEPVFGNNDRLKAEVIPADTGVTVDGALYAWVRGAS